MDGEEQAVAECVPWNKSAFLSELTGRDSRHVGVA